MELLTIVHRWLNDNPVISIPLVLPFFYWLAYRQGVKSVKEKPNA